MSPNHGFQLQGSRSAVVSCVLECGCRADPVRGLLEILFKHGVDMLWSGILISKLVTSLKTSVIASAHRGGSRVQLQYTVSVLQSHSRPANSWRLTTLWHDETTSILKDSHKNYSYSGQRIWSKLLIPFINAYAGKAVKVTNVKRRQCDAPAVDWVSTFFTFPTAPPGLPQRALSRNSPPTPWLSAWVEAIILA